MVEFGSGPVKEGIDNTVFIVPGIIIVTLVVIPTYCSVLYCYWSAMDNPADVTPNDSVTAAPSMDAEGNIKPGEFGILGYESSASMYMFVICLVIPGALIAFFAYKLVASLREKERLKEEKKKMKLQRREKEMKTKLKKK